ncbi:LysR family substrate-binding domain-containing protein [Rhodococcus sp. NPDC058521]|uniref:LysR family substrate-binding domain-containing protein n=1 Tax=Rhodococcus sp. NPDC058521 TaxID=3346536 RepID=UPI00364EC54E
MTDAAETTPFRLAYVPGVTPSKWVRIWNERITDVPLELVTVAAAEATTRLRDGSADAGLVRLTDRDPNLSAIPLYTEVTVVVVPKDHVFCAADEIGVADLSDEIVLSPLDDCLSWSSPPGKPAVDRPASTGDAVELVAAGIGVLVVPQSLARLHHRKDLTYRPVVGAPESRIALSWREDHTTELVEEFIGIVRGRTVNSSRGRKSSEQQPTKTKPARKKPDKPARNAAKRTPAPRRSSRSRPRGRR